MADNVAITSGTGTTIKTDEVGAAHYQEVKISHGADGAATPSSATTPFPVQVGDTGAQASVFPATFLRTTDEPRQVFYDPFDAVPDTTNVWTSTSGNGGSLPSVSEGVLTVNEGTTANGFSRAVSIPTFKLPIPAWLGNSFLINLPDGAAPFVNAYRFWGFLASAGTPTVAAPMTNGVGFELTTTGKLQAVVWASGIRTLIQDLSSTGNNKQPLDNANHRYIIYVRTDRAYWYIDGLSASNLVATSNLEFPAIQTLSTGLLAIGNSTPPAAGAIIQCAGLAVWDTGKNATQLADGTFPWRKAQINSFGSLLINTQQKNTYRASTNAVFLPHITVTLPFLTIKGSATKTARIKKIVVSGLTTTAVGYQNIGLRKYSTGESGGTATTLSQIGVDSLNAFGTLSAIRALTAAPAAAGTTVGDLSSRRVISQANTAAAAGIPQIIEFDFTKEGSTELVLRGIAEGIGLYWITAPATAASMLLDIEWTEE